MIAVVIHAVDPQEGKKNMFSFSRKTDYSETVLKDALRLMEAGVLVVPDKNCIKAYSKGLVVIDKLTERNHFFDNIEKFTEIISRGMPADKERMTLQKIAMANMTFDEDKFSVCGWKTALGEMDIRVPRLDDEKKYKKPEIDLVMVNPSKREMILVEYKCKGESVIGARQNIAQQGIDYMQILYSNHMSEIRDELLNAYNVYRKIKSMPELPKDTYNEYRVKVGFLFVDKIYENGVVVSEITEDYYKKGMELLNSNCQYLGDNLVYIRARTLENVRFDEWKTVRDSDFMVTI